MITKSPTRPFESPRPVGIAALVIFFLAGSLISFIAGISLLVPGSFLQPLWRVNPKGHGDLVRIGLWAVLLLFVASASCVTAAVGLWRRAGWGHKIAMALITINLLSDVANTILGTEPRAIIGVPVAFAILLYMMSRPVRDYFASPRN